jgi:hypothetical protein
VIGIIQAIAQTTHSLLVSLIRRRNEDLPFLLPSRAGLRCIEPGNQAFGRAFRGEPGATPTDEKRLDEIRKKLVLLDELTWKERLVSGAENHYWLINSSDFNGDPDIYEEQLDSFIKTHKIVILCPPG